MGSPIVFVSYSHDGELHKTRVMRFADRVRDELGCDVRLDGYVDGSVSNWPIWMRRQIAGAKYVLMIFTRRYRRAFDQDQTGGTGRGVAWEGAIIQNSIYASSGDPGCKFVPVALRGKDLASVPRDVFSGSAYAMPHDWPRLTRHLAGNDADAKPAVRGSANTRPSTLRHRDNELAKLVLPVLFVGAEEGTGLDLRGQLARTKEAIAQGRLGASVQILGVFNITPDQMLMQLNRSCPVILHLSGKQDAGQIRMHDDSGRLTPVSADILAGLLAAYHRTLRLLILDTCWSLPQARRVIQTIECAIGVEGPIAEPVAVDFFAMFYNALSSGYSVQRAYDLAHGLQMAKIEGSRRYHREIQEILECKFDPVLHLPRLVTRADVNPSEVFLVS